MVPKPWIVWQCGQDASKFLPSARSDGPLCQPQEQGQPVVIISSYLLRRDRRCDHRQAQAQACDSKSYIDGQSSSRRIGHAQATPTFQHADDIRNPRDCLVSALDRARLQDILRWYLSCFPFPLFACF